MPSSFLQKIFFVSMIVLVAIPCIHSHSTLPRVVGVRGNLFIDELGRHRQFRGTNVVYKAAPWHPDTSPAASPRWSFNQQDIEILASHGVTAIRLGIMWPGVEPVRGVYNTTYLQVMKSIVQACQDAGIYVLLDFHQDGLSEKFCGEGVPMWAAQPVFEGDGTFGFPFPVGKADRLNADGTPTTVCDSVFYDKLQFSLAAGSAYERLYTNHDKLRDAFVNYWKVVAQTFLPFKNILGYDLMNEPFAGNVESSPTLLLPGVADSLLLSPFYDVVAEGIRSVDPNAIIFFEPVTWDNFAVGFKHVPGGPQYGSKSVLSFHHYEPPQLFNLNATSIERSLDMLRLSCGGMLTEFEMGWKNGQNVAATREKMQLMERDFWSYLGWEYTDYIQKTGTNNGLRDPDTGLVRPDMARVYARTYASAIPGIPLRQQFDDNSGRYVLELEMAHTERDGGQLGRLLEIRVNAGLYYSSGLVVNTEMLVGGQVLTANKHSVFLNSSMIAGNTLVVDVGSLAPQKEKNLKGLDDNQKIVLRIEVLRNQQRRGQS